jgi:hypothetical protein
MLSWSHISAALCVGKRCEQRWPSGGVHLAEELTTFLAEIDAPEGTQVRLRGNIKGLP